MLKRKILNLIQRSFLRKQFLRFAIFLNNYSYSLIKKFLVAPGDVHPKHKIIKYKEFFVDNIRESDIVLDIGCYRGEVSFMVAKKAKKVVGIEIDKEKIDEAKKNNDLNNLEFIHGDATNYDFFKLGIDKFDKAILSNVLEHIENRVDFLKRLRGITDVILLRVPMLDRDWLTVYKKENSYEYRLDPTHFTEYIQDELEKELDFAGWRLSRYSRQFGEVWGIVIKK